MHAQSQAKKLFYAQALCAWHPHHGRHHLPWQDPITPYRVWLAEIMLQQTQVQTVIPYFHRFIHAIPSLTHLAQTSEDQVLSLWSGLGYYRRARLLHQCAQTLHNQGLVTLPCNLQQLEQLPGIGPSTAAAIYSLAYNKPAAILDGNVKRVLSRYCGLPGYPETTLNKKTLWHQAQSLCPQEQARIYTQAQMDLGATICHKKDPLCHQCPLQPKCYAYQHNLTHMIPAPRPKRTIPHSHKTMLLIQCNNRIFLHKKQTGLWENLWVLPIINEPFETWRQSFAQHIQSIQTFKPLQHRFTHKHWTIAIYALNWQGESPLDHGRWWTRNKALALGIPKPVRTILNQSKHLA
jgi:A/G-specific adenine glycosylase